MKTLLFLLLSLNLVAQSDTLIPIAQTSLEGDSYHYKTNFIGWELVDESGGYKKNIDIIVDTNFLKVEICDGDLVTQVFNFDSVSNELVGDIQTKLYYFINGKKRLELYYVDNIIYRISLKDVYFKCFWANLNEEEIKTFYKINAHNLKIKKSNKK